MTNALPPEPERHAVARQIQKVDARHAMGTMLFTGKTPAHDTIQTITDYGRIVCNNWIERRGFIDDTRTTIQGLYLPNGQIAGRGICTRVVLLDLTVLAWWPDDLSASILQLKGAHDDAMMWHCFKHRFPDIAAKHTRPRVKHEVLR